jgi:ubiquinone/menaquinone biosynthesis C-methylase UbiE
MQNKNLEQHRITVVSGLSGTGIEIGFGSGLNLPYYKNITKLYALDCSEELYEIAKKNMENVSFPIEYLQASAEQIPLSDNRLDFVVSSLTLCSIHNPEQALKEIFRILKPGGKFSFFEHGKSPRKLIFTAQNLLTPLSTRIAGGCHLNRDIETLILDTDFDIQKIKKFYLKSKPLGCMYKGIALAKK